MSGRYVCITCASAKNAQPRNTRGGNGHDIGYRGCPRCDFIWRAMGSADLRHHLHGDDRQPAIRLDPVRQSDRSEISLGRAAIQVAFTLFVLTETWLVPIEGYLIDRFGPKVMFSGSGVLVAIAWVINSFADSLTLLYIGAAIGGIGAGVIYGGSVGN